MAPAYLRQPAGNQDLLPGARFTLFAPAGEWHGATAAAAGIRIHRHQQIVSLEGSFVMGGMLAFLGRDMAVDLGTANTLVYVRRRGIEPWVPCLPGSGR
jgi:hypothetical protein